MDLIADQMMDAIHFADFVMAKEKKDRIGSTAATVSPMKFLFFHGQDEILGLIGPPLRHPQIDEKDVLALVARIFALALDAKAVLHATEAWTATRCAACGSSIAESRDGRCSICGTEVVPPSKNPYRKEMLICTLSVRNSPKTLFWTSRFERGDDGEILGFTDEFVRKSMEGSGRFTHIWELEPWMGPHFAVNLPVVLHALGKEVTEDAAEIARVVEQMVPSDFSFVHLQVNDLLSVMKKLRLENN
jgi:hypothetical protein